MTRWRCPACDREFGRTNQAHTCVPGCSLDKTFAGRPAYQRRIYDKLLHDVSEAYHLASL